MEKHYKNIAKATIFLLLTIIHTGFLKFVGMGALLSILMAVVLAYLVSWNLYTFEIAKIKHAAIFFAFYACLEAAIGGLFFYIEVMTDSGTKALRIDVREFVGNYTGIIYSVYFSIIFFTSAMNFFIKTHANINEVLSNEKTSYKNAINALKSNAQTNVNDYIKSTKERQEDRYSRMSINEKKKVDICLKLKKQGLSYYEIGQEIKENKDWVYYRISHL